MQRATSTIAGFAGRLLSCVDARARSAQVSCSELARLFECKAVLCRTRRPSRIIASEPRRRRLTPADIARGRLGSADGRIVGRGAPRLNPAEWLFFPVKSDGRMLAALGLARDDGRPPVAEDSCRCSPACSTRRRWRWSGRRSNGEMRDVASLRERDRLRGALLSSVGHDLRTPLTAILAAAAELRAAKAADAALVDDDREPRPRKLDRYIANLLDMARIEAGRDPAQRRAGRPGRCRRRRGARPQHRACRPSQSASTFPPTCRWSGPIRNCSTTVLINLLDNAARYSAPAAPIRIAGAARTDGSRSVDRRRGPGPAAGRRRGMFDTSRGSQGSDRKGGAGLGLAIVKGFAEAMGLSVAARQPRRRHGRDFHAALPGASDRARGGT